jgi:branched-chain amino acid transport system ATP-binding protein
VTKLLLVKNLDVYYAKREAVRDVSLKVEEGKVVALLGSNGAGKTTILNAISGFISPRKGEIEFNGKSIRKRNPHEIVELGIGQVSQGRDLFTDLSVMENLRMGAVLHKGKNYVKEKLEEIFENFQILEERSEQKAGTLSGGEQQMLAIGRAMMNSPKLLLLDEPTTGLAPIYSKRIENLLDKLREKETTMLLVEQNAPLAVSLSNYFYVLRNGRIVAEGDTKSLPEDVSNFFRKYYI